MDDEETADVVVVETTETVDDPEPSIDEQLADIRAQIGVVIAGHDAINDRLAALESPAAPAAAVEIAADIPVEGSTVSTTSETTQTVETPNGDIESVVVIKRRYRRL